MHTARRHSYRATIARRGRADGLSRRPAVRDRGRGGAGGMHPQTLRQYDRLGLVVPAAHGGQVPPVLDARGRAAARDARLSRRGRLPRGHPPHPRAREPGGRAARPRARARVGARRRAAVPARLAASSPPTAEGDVVPLRHGDAHDGATRWSSGVRASPFGMKPERSTLNLNRREHVEGGSMANMQGQQPRRRRPRARSSSTASTSPRSRRAASSTRSSGGTPRSAGSARC